MSATLWGALATAGVLGVTHAVEPDHVAGISSVTSQYGDSRLSALVGACFSLGHVALVIVWLVGGYLLLGRTEYPAVFDTVGTLGVAVLLGVLGAAMAVGGLRSIRHSHVHEHDGTTHAHSHLHLPLIGGDQDHPASGDHAHPESADHGHSDDAGHTHDGASYESTRTVGDSQVATDHGRESTDGVVPHAHGHGIGAYLKTGVVGALFTLSPPLSMILFASTLFPQYGGGAVALAVAAYAVSITVTMSAIGAGVGTLFGATTVSPRLHAGARAFAGVVVVGFAVSMLPGTVL
jgi:ABC-type nickel/cobalt efflux system permease component RcnA